MQKLSEIRRTLWGTALRQALFAKSGTAYCIQPRIFLQNLRGLGGASNNNLNMSSCTV
jgi:hypothetical protein